MPTFIKTGFWEKVAKGYKGWLNLDDLIRSIGSGIPGPVGPIGPQGEQGIQGVPGIQGEDGPQGIQGVQGVEGVQGPIGPQGIQGTAGNSITLLGSYADYAAFLAGAGGSPGATVGDAWVLLSDGSLYSWNGSVWFDAGDIQGPQGPQGIQGEQGIQGIQGIEGPEGPQGVQGVQGEQGIPGTDAPTDRIYSGAFAATIDEFGTTRFDGNVLPSADNAYTLGSTEFRWKSLRLGEGTLYMTDTVTGLDAALTVTNGTLFVDGVSLMSVSGIKFADNSIQYTAPVNADWNATTGLAQVLNKPSIPAAQVNSDWNSVSGVSQILNKPTIPAAQVNSDWNAVSGLAQILNKPFIPNLTGYGVSTTYAPVWSSASGTLTYTGTPATGSYIKTGQMVNFAINVICTTVTNFGTIAGQYLLTLPFAAANIVSVVGAVYDASTGKWYHMRGLTSVGSTTLTLWDGNSAEYTKMNGNSPINLTTADSFHISGTYQTV